MVKEEEMKKRQGPIFKLPVTSYQLNMTEIQKKCRQCGSGFQITDEDLKFYDKISPVFNGKKYQVPPPTFCSDCRQQRRLASRNERKLYHRKCDLTGKQIISIYNPDSPYTVYDQDSWWSEKWDPMTYSRVFDFNRTFFEQFNELLQVVPLASTSIRRCENSDYAPWAVDGRNLYLSVGGRYNEDCFYGMFPTRCKDCMDFIRPVASELCYEVIDCVSCYHCFWSQLCEQCNDCLFCFDCRSCNDCFCCAGLKHKRFCFLNKQLSEQEYKKRMADLKLTEKTVDEYRRLLNGLQISYPQICLRNINAEGCLGDFVRNSKNVFYGFDVQNCEDCSFAYDIRDAKNCYDNFMGAFKNELVYETHSALDTKYSMSLNVCWDGNFNLFYCDHCFGSNNLLGCVGLRGKQYCIFNKQYSKNDYEDMAPKIIEHMQKTGEWGEFFPISISPFGYNETIANEYFPVSREFALNQGWKWYDADDLKQTYIGPAYNIPDDINQVDDSICSKILTCAVSGKPYKIIPQELAFYKKAITDPKEVSLRKA